MPEPTEVEIPFLQHLEELRIILFKCLISVCIVSPIIFMLHDPILRWYVEIYNPIEGSFLLNYMGLIDPIILKFKLTIFCSFFVSSPYIAYQIWSFIAPGLYQNERKAIIKFSVASWLFFLTGVVFAIFFIIPSLISYSKSLETEYLRQMANLKDFINLSISISFGFGVMFQFPIAIFLLIKAGIVNPETLSNKRPYIIILILVLSALLTPPDIISQLMMGIPTILLFEASLLLARLTTKKGIATTSSFSETLEDDEDSFAEIEYIDTKNDNSAEDEFDFDYNSDDFFDHNEHEHFDDMCVRRKRKKRSIRYIKGAR